MGPEIDANMIFQVGYYLAEDRNWALDVAELERSITAARQQNVNVKAIVIINPGNPTGQVKIWFSDR